MSSITVSQSGSVEPARARRLPLFWRILSYLFLFVLVNLVANLARVGMDALGLPALVSRFAFTLVYIAGVVLLTYVYRRFVDRKPWSSIGLLPVNTNLRQLAGGVVLGIIIVAVILGFELNAHWIRITGAASSAAAGILLVDSLLLAAGFGVCEEVCMRGYLFQNLGERRPIWQAALITGIIFGLFHLLSLGFGVRGLTFFVFALILNVLLVWTRLMTGSLWMAIGVHTAFDWAAINLGLGSVVLADQHLLQVQRTVAVPAEDLLAAIVVLLSIAVLVAWARRHDRAISLDAHLSDDGQPVIS